MSDEREVQQLLEGLDRRRSPRPEFERALRDELLAEPLGLGESPPDPDVVVDLEQPPGKRANAPRRRPARLLLAAAVATMLAIGTLVAVTQLASDDGDVATQSGGETEQLATAACARFKEDAFATVSRPDLLGPERDAVFRDRAKAQDALNRLTRALGRFATDLRTVGLSDPELMRVLALADSRLSVARDELAAGSATQVAKSQVNGIDELLVDAHRRLIALGVTRCL